MNRVRQTSEAPVKCKCQMESDGGLNPAKWRERAVAPPRSGGRDFGTPRSVVVGWGVAMRGGGVDH